MARDRRSRSSTSCCSTSSSVHSVASKSPKRAPTPTSAATRREGKKTETVPGKNPRSPRARQDHLRQQQAPPTHRERVSPNHRSRQCSAASSATTSPSTALPSSPSTPPVTSITPQRKAVVTAAASQLTHSTSEATRWTHDKLSEAAQRSPTAAEVHNRVRCRHEVLGSITGSCKSEADTSTIPPSDRTERHCVTEQCDDGGREALRGQRRSPSVSLSSLRRPVSPFSLHAASSSTVIAEGTTGQRRLSGAPSAAQSVTSPRERCEAGKTSGSSSLAATHTQSALPVSPTKTMEAQQESAVFSQMSRVAGALTDTMSTMEATPSAVLLSPAPDALTDVAPPQIMLGRFSTRQVPPPRMSRALSPVDKGHRLRGGGAALPEAGTAVASAGPKETSFSLPPSISVTASMETPASVSFTHCHRSIGGLPGAPKPNSTKGLVDDNEDQTHPDAAECNLNTPHRIKETAIRKSEVHVALNGEKEEVGKVTTAVCGSPTFVAHSPPVHPAHVALPLPPTCDLYAEQQPVPILQKTLRSPNTAPAFSSVAGGSFRVAGYRCHNGIEGEEADQMKQRMAALVAQFADKVEVSSPAESELCESHVRGEREATRPSLGSTAGNSGTVFALAALNSGTTRGVPWSAATTTATTNNTPPAERSLCPSSIRSDGVDVSHKDFMMEAPHSCTSRSATGLDAEGALLTFSPSGEAGAGSSLMLPSVPLRPRSADRRGVSIDESGDPTPRDERNAMQCSLSRRSRTNSTVSFVTQPYEQFKRAHTIDSESPDEESA